LTAVTRALEVKIRQYPIFKHSLAERTADCSESEDLGEHCRKELEKTDYEELNQDELGNISFAERHVVDDGFERCAVAHISHQCEKTYQYHG
jgi:hypothetical protein